MAPVPLSVEAFQAKLIVLAVVPVERRLEGTEGAVVSGGGVTTLLTVTVREAATVVLPTASRAMAVRVWLPLLMVVVSKVVEYGLDVSSAPILLLSGSPA